MSHGGSNTKLTFTPLIPGTLATAFSTQIGNIACHRTSRRGQGHFDLDVALVIDVDFIDQAKLVDIDRNLRIVGRF